MIVLELCMFCKEAVAEYPILTPNENGSQYWEVCKSCKDEYDKSKKRAV